MLREMKTTRDYLDRLNFLIVASAGNFPDFAPYGDDLKANVRLVLQSLADGLPAIATRLKDPSRAARAESLLNSARDAFENDDRDNGVRSLDDMADVIAPNRYADSGKE